MIYNSEEEIETSNLTQYQKQQEVLKFRQANPIRSIQGNNAVNAPDTAKAVAKADAISKYSTYELKKFLADQYAVADQVPVKPNNKYSPSNPNKPHYLTVAGDRQISGMVNQFVANYIKSGATDFNKEWNNFIKTGTKISGDPYTTGVKDRALKTIEYVQKRSGTRTPYSGFSLNSKQGKVNGIGITVDALMDKSKTSAVFFTGNSLDERALSTSARKVFSVYKDLKTVEYVTTKGTVKFVNQSSTNTTRPSRGISPVNAQDKFISELDTFTGPTGDYVISNSQVKKTVENYRYNNRSRPYADLETSVGVYDKHQAALDLRMKNDLGSLTGLAVRTMGSNNSSTQVNRILDMSVKELKAFGSQFPEFNNLNSWTTADHMSVRDVISTDQSLHAQRRAEKGTGKISAMRSKIALAKAYRLAENLGIDKKVITSETIGKFMGEKNDFRGFKASVSEINAFLGDSSLQMKTLYPNGYKQALPYRDAFLKTYATKPEKAMDVLFKHMDDSKFLKRSGLLEESALNPLMNTRGKIQQRATEHLAEALMGGRKVPKKIDNSFLEFYATNKQSKLDSVFDEMHAKHKYVAKGKITAADAKLAGRDALNNFLDIISNVDNDMSMGKQQESVQAKYMDQAAKLAVGDDVSYDIETAKLEGFSNQDRDDIKTIQKANAHNKAFTVGDATEEFINKQAREVDGLRVEKQSLNQSLFGELVNDPNKDGPHRENDYTVMKKRHAEGNLSATEFIRLSEAYTTYTGLKSPDKKSLFAELNTMENEYLFKGKDMSVKSPWIGMNPYLRNKAQYGTSIKDLELFMSMGVMDLKDKHNFKFSTNKTNNLAKQSKWGKAKPVNYGPLIDSIKKFSFVALPDSKEHKEITGKLKGYLEGTNPGVDNTTRTKLLTRINSGNFKVSEVEDTLVRSLAADKKAKAAWQKKYSDNKTFKDFESSVDFDQLVSTLGQSQGFGKESYGKLKYSEILTGPKKERLTEKTANNLNNNIAIQRYHNSPEFKKQIQDMAVGNKQDKTIWGSEAVEYKRKRMSHMFDSLDANTALDSAMKNKIKTIGTELYSKYHAANSGQGMDSLILSKSIDTYAHDVGMLLQGSSDLDSKGVKAEKEMLTRRFKEGSTGEIAIDKYYGSEARKVISNSNRLLGNAGKYKPNDEIFSEMKNIDSMIAKSDTSRSYGPTSTRFDGRGARTNLSDYASFIAKARSNNANLTGLGRGTRDFYDMLDSKAGLKLNTSEAADLNKLKRMGSEYGSISPIAQQDTFIKAKKPVKNVDNLKFRKWFYGFSKGDLPNKLAKGGKIPGDGNVDDVPALLMKGETVLDKETSKKLGINTQQDYERFKAAVAKGPVSKFGGGGSTNDILNAINMSGTKPSNVNENPNTLVVMKVDEPSKDVKNLMVNAKEVKIEASEAVDVKSVKTGSVYDQDNITKLNNELLNTDSSERARQIGINNQKIVETKGKNLSIASVEETIGRGFSDGETKKILEALKVKGSKYDDASLGDLSRGSSILPNPLGDALGKLENTKGVKTQIAARTESKFADMVNMRYEQSVDDFAADLNTGNKRGIITSSLSKAGGTFKDKALQDKLNVVNARAAEIMAPGASSIEAALAGDNSVSNLPKTSQDTLSGIINDPEKLAQFQRVAGSNTGKALNTMLKPDQVSKLTGSIDFLSKNMDEANRLFGTNEKAPTDRKTMNAYIDKINSAETGYKYSNNVNTAQDMRKQKEILSSLQGTLNTTDNLEGHSKLGEMGAQIGNAQHLKESSKMRWENFGDLMVQNAAFGASYAVLGGITASIGGGVDFVAGLDERLHNLKAITGSTSSELDMMATSVKLVSTETKFSANEIADAATILGQAGFTAQDITESLGGVVKLATATGSTLEDSTQTLTSALTIWDAPVRDSTKFANQFTAAINQSKLDVKSLSLALQYTGNIAAQGGIPVDDVLTITSLMKDAGIKQGSTVGTGQRLVYSDILSPSKKFTKQLGSVGISKTDLSDSFDEGGVLESLKLMRDSGFGFSQANKGMEVREGAAYMAVLNQLDKADLFKSNITGTNAADLANDTQMESFNNRLKNMFNSWGIGLDEMTNSKMESVGNLFDSLTYNPEDKKKGNFDFSKQTLYEQINNPEDATTGGMGTGLALATAGGLGVLSARQMHASTSVPKAGYGTTARGALAGAAGSIGKMGTIPKVGALGAVGLGYTALTSKDKPSNEFWADLSKTFVTTLAGVAGAAAAAPLSMGAGSITMAASTTVAYRATIGEAVDSWIDQVFDVNAPSPMDFVDNINTRLGSSKSALDDLYKKGKELDKIKGLQITDESTPDETATIKRTVNNLGREYNEQFKPQREYLERETGKKTDFTALESGTIDDLKKVRKEFTTELSKTISDVTVPKMFSELDKTFDSPDDYKKGTTSGMVNESSSRLDISISKLANISATALMSNKDKFEKIIANTKDNVTSAALKTKQDDAYTKGVDDYWIGKVGKKGGWVQGLASANPFKGLAAHRAGVAARDEVKLSDDDLKLISDANNNSITNLKSQMLKAYTSTQDPDEIIKFGKGVAALRDSGELSKADANKTLNDASVQYTRIKASDLGFTKFETKFVDQVSKIEKVNEAFKSFYKQAVNMTTDSVMELSRTKGGTNLGRAMELNNLDGIGDMRGKVRDSMFTGNKEGFDKFMDRSASAEGYKNGTKQWNSKNIDIDILKALTENMEFIGADKTVKIVQAQNMKTMMEGLPVKLEDVIANFRADPVMTSRYYQRERGLENMGLETNVPGGAIGFATKFSMEEVLAAPIEDIKAGFNNIHLQQQDIAKTFAFRRIDTQTLNKAQKLFGGGVVPMDSSAKARAEEDLQIAFDKKNASIMRGSDNSMAKAGIGFVRSIEKLDRSLEFQKETLTINRDNQLEAMEVQHTFNTNMKQLNAIWQKQEALTQMSYQVEDLDLKTKYANEDLDTNRDRQITNLKTQTTRAIDNLVQQREWSYDALDLNRGRAIESAQLSEARNIEDVGINYNRSVEKLDLQRNWSVEDLDLSIAQYVEDLVLNTTRSIEDLSIKTTQARQDLDIQKAWSFEDLDTQVDRYIEDLATSSARAIEDLNTKNVRATEDLTTQNNWSVDDLNTKTQRSVTDLGTSKSRSVEDLSTSYDRSLANMQLQRSWSFEDAELNADRSVADALTQFDRSTENLYTQTDRSTDSLELNTDRARQDANTQMQRSAENLTLKSNRAMTDLVTSIARKTEDIDKNFGRQIAAIHLNFDRQIAATERAKEDTVDAFERSMDKPVNITLDAEAFMKIADVMDNNTLALDAHKAELGANTSAIKQLIGIQTVKEDITKDAYKYAYKGVGGEVYDDEGVLSEEFRTLYEDYLAQNNEALIDTVLDNSLDTAMSGSSFDINNAMTSADYMAAQVANPTTAVTSESLVEGSGYTNDELVQALVGLNVGEVRLTTNQGVVLEAQGNLSGALFDLESAMINYDIQIREAGINLNNALDDAATNFRYALDDLRLSEQRALEDLALAHQRELDDIALAAERSNEDINVNFGQGMEDIGINFATGLEDININFGRSMEDIALNSARSIEDINLSFDRALVSLTISNSQAMEDINLSFERAMDDIALNSSRGLEDINLSFERALESLLLNLSRSNDDLLLNSSRSMEDINTTTTRSTEDINTNFERSLDTLLLNESRSFDEISLNYTRSLTDLSTSQSRSMDEINLNFERSMLTLENSTSDALEDITTSMTRIYEDIAQNYENGKEDIQISFSQSLITIQTNFSNSLDDINTSYKNSQEDIDASHDRNLDAINTNFDRSIISIETNLANSLTALDLSYQASITATGVGFQNAMDALDASAIHNKEELEIGLVDVLQDIMDNTDFAISETALDNDANQESIDLQFQRLADDLTIDSAAAKLAYEESLSEGLKEVVVEAALFKDIFDRSMNNIDADALPDTAIMLGKLVTSMDNALVDMELDWSGFIKVIDDGWTKMFADESIIKTFKDAGVTGFKLLIKGIMDGLDVTVTDAMDLYKESIAGSFSASVGGFAEDMKVGTDKAIEKIDSSTAKNNTAISAYTLSMSGAAGSMDSLQLTLASFGSSGSVAIANAINTVITQANAAGITISQQVSSVGASSFTPSTSSDSGFDYDGTAWQPPEIGDIDLSYAGWAPGYSTGTTLDGYGGGDIIPAMLEPGESILTKETTRALGKDMISTLNSPRTVDLIKAPASIPGGLSLPSMQNMDSNNVTNDFNIGITVNSNASIDMIEANIERIADGVQRVFQEYI